MSRTPARRDHYHQLYQHPTVLPGFGGGLEVGAPEVRVETVSLDDSGNRQIGPRSRTTALLKERHDDIEAAVAEASAVLQESVAKLGDSQGWRVSTVEAKFGLTLTAEAGVIVSKVSAEASFEVTITVERR